MIIFFTGEAGYIYIYIFFLGGGGGESFYPSNTLDRTLVIDGKEKHIKSH